MTSHSFNPDKRTRIISAALQLFVENGFHGTSTGLVAREAGIAAGTLFQYFRTKDELIIAIYIAVKEELATHLVAAAPATAGIRATMAAQFHGALRWSIEHQVKFRFIQLFHSSPFLAQVDQLVLLRHAEPHLRVIQQGVDDGTLRPLPVALVYALVSSHTFGVFQYLTLSTRHEPETSDVVRVAFDMLWEMLTSTAFSVTSPASTSPSEAT